MAGDDNAGRWNTTVPGVDDLRVGDWFRLVQKDETHWAMRVGDQNFDIEVPSDASLPVLLRHPVLGDIGVCVARKERERGK